MIHLRRAGDGLILFGRHTNATQGGARRVAAVRKYRVQRVGAVHAAGQKESCGKAAQSEGRAVVVIVEFCPRLTRQLVGWHKSRAHGEHCAIMLRNQLTHLALRIDAMDIDTTK